MAKIIVNNPKQVINGGAKKYYFKVKGLGGLKGDKGDKGDTGAQGLAGANGADGFSPIATVTPTDTGATISITDLNGTTTASITNGTDGQNGANGQNGADGFSPIATVTQTSTGATISITDAQGTTTADIANGTGSNAPIATTSVAGIVKPDGTTITVAPDGTISSASGHTLTPATDTTLGGIKVGSNLSITADGTLSADAQQVTLYSSTGQNTDGAMTQKATTDALALKADSSSLAPVATSGNYNDLNNLPTLPTVNNGALTIQQNGTTLDTFTANSSDDKTVNIQTITAATVAPAEEVGAITTNMIADGAVTAKKINPTSFAMLVYVGDIAYVKGTYNNSSIPLTNKIDYYAASDVGAAIESSTNLVITVPTDGTYIARAKASLWTNSNSWDYMTLSIRKNGNIFTRTMAPKINGSWGFVDTEGYTTVANGDALTVYLNTNGNNFTDGNISRQDSKLMVEIYKVG